MQGDLFKISIIILIRLFFNQHTIIFITALQMHANHTVQLNRCSLHCKECVPLFLCIMADKTIHIILHLLGYRLHLTAVWMQNACTHLHNCVLCSCRLAVASICLRLDCKTPQRPNCSCHRLLPPHTVSCLQHTHLQTQTQNDED